MSEIDQIFVDLGVDIEKKARRFKIKKFIAAGGMGAVYHVVLNPEGVDAALKLIFPGCLSNSNFVRRFQREAGILEKLSHPNLLRYFETGKIEDYYYLLTEFVEGGSLLDVLNSEGVLPPAKALYYLKGIAGALDYAHQNHCIHRDIKPSNILLSLNGKDLKIADFGLARKYNTTQKEDQTQLTDFGQVLGTLGFMPPEQLEGDPDKITPASDVFALGILFFIMLTGSTPFGVGPEYRKNLPSNPFPMEVLSQFPPPVKKLLGKMVEKDPSNRLQSMKEVVKAVPECCGFFPEVNFKTIPLNLELEKMVFIPGGPFLYSARNKMEDLPPFSIDKFPVTNLQYKKFLMATGHPPPPHFSVVPGEGFFRHFRGPTPYLDSQLDFHPVVQVTLEDALAYARWSHKSLPTPRQWEKSFRGPNGNLFPWGNDFSPDKLNFGRWGGDSFGGTTPVTRYPEGISSFEIWDLAGNCWEMCLDPNKNQAFLKGGGFNVAKRESFAGYFRVPFPKGERNFAVGFRCVKNHLS